MKMFPVYKQFDIEPVRGEGPYLWDEDGNKYLDFYGGHAVISVGHSHPAFVRTIQQQMEAPGYYSNAVPNRLQDEVAERLGKSSGYEEYQLFLCNSGAEAVENALKLASFQNGREKIIAFRNGFHGRTSAAVNVTDNENIQAPINRNLDVEILPLNDFEALAETFSDTDICAVIIEGIQGIGGVHIPETEFLQHLRKLCTENGATLILDEIQSGYGRSGRFFAHQFAGIHPDLITVAKGMGNGFPIAGVLISPDFEAKSGMLGSTFGGNHLASAAGIAVLDIIEKENLLENAGRIGDYLISNLQSISGIADIRGKGLMLGIEFPFPAGEIREALLYKQRIFTGSSSDKNTLRILPPLTITEDHAEQFLDALTKVLNYYE